jgi:hypothetical protein
MPLSRTELWTALGVVATAIVGGFGLGYYTGRDSTQATLDAKNKELAEQTKISNGINVSLLLDALARQSQELGEKQALEHYIHQITSELSAIKQALNASKENQQKQALIDQSTSDLNRLRSILEKDFSEIS